MKAVCSTRRPGFRDFHSEIAFRCFEFDTVNIWHDNGFWSWLRASGEKQRTQARETESCPTWHPANYRRHLHQPAMECRASGHFPFQFSPGRGLGPPLRAVLQRPTRRVPEVAAWLASAEAFRLCESWRA